MAILSRQEIVEGIDGVSSHEQWTNYKCSTVKMSIRGGSHLGRPVFKDSMAQIMSYHLTK